MGYGLFGKLPQKRDFLALGLARGVLEPFEQWLQSAVAVSRNQLGGAWQERYLVSPIWRFWIGRDVFGTQCAGALMPSVDGVGRFFPLAVFYCAEPGGDVPPPSFDPQDAWYEAIEERLLGVLERDRAVEPDALTAGLAPPALAGTGPEPRPVARGRGWLWEGEGPVADLVGGLHEAELWAVSAGRSYWWTPAAPSGAATVYSGPGLPDHGFYVDMIGGLPEIRR